MSQSSEKWDILNIASRASQFVEKNFKTAFAIFIIAVVAASIGVFYKKNESSKEITAFNNLFPVTKDYKSIKEGFDKGKEAEAAKKAPKKEAKVDETPKDEKVYAKATGDMDKDYGPVVEKLESFIDSNSGMQASGEAALTLSQIYQDYDQPEKGAKALTEVLKPWKNQNILFSVMHMRAGDLYASAGDCEKATPHWETISTQENFLKTQAQLKLAVCLQKIGRLDDAKARLQAIEAKAPNSAEGFNAKRYLRYLKFMDKVDTKPTDNKAETQSTQSENKS